MEVIPVISSGLFAGATLAISIAEHPARQNMDPQQGLKQFQQSYKRIAPSQIALALTSAGSSLYLASKGGEAKNVYLAAGIAMVAMLPFTKIFLMPTNNRLNSADKKEDVEVKQLFSKWGKLHAVRTAVSILAFTGLTIAALKTAKT
ncbi:probable anthrone oxygenase tpcL [Coccomyxa sp. Obi]|nr:probable anthrone oxygenase tpcL [Coccomyxa sp. Obi]